jgi:ParB-like chromosome segregation protein Spo0J
MSEQMLDMSIVRIDGDTQPRTAINPGIVQEYAEAMEAGVQFPPVTVVHDGAAHWLVDGFHRFFAHRRLSRQQIKAEVITGELTEARWLSLAANKAHGVRRSMRTKRRSPRR